MGTKVMETTMAPQRLVLSPDRSVIHADGEDLVCITVSTVDPNGLFVPTANDPVEFDVSGPGKILGVGNGDPSSHDLDKSCRRRLFNGLAMLLVQAGRDVGTMTVTARAPHLWTTSTTVKTQRAKQRPSI
jgi:beta-galactosidase